MNKTLSKRFTDFFTKQRVKLAHWIAPSNKRVDQKLDMTLREWLIYHHNNIVFDQVSWMGVGTQRNVMDGWLYQQLIWQVKPELIIEIGSNEGGGTLFYAHLLDIIGHGAVISVDIQRHHYNITHPRITAITGDSGSPEVISQVTNLARGKRVMLIHDGDHQKEAVLRDLRAYSGLVSIGSYLIVEDGIVDIMGTDFNWGYPDGPVAAVEEFLTENDNFEIDDSCERYILTYNPKGYLKRV